MTDLVQLDISPDLDLAAGSTPELVTMIAGLKAIEREVTELRRSAEREVVTRMLAHGQRTLILPDGYTITVRAGKRRVWDPDDLENTVRDLAHRGIVNAGSLTGLIRRELKVDGAIAARLLNQLTGQPRTDVEACFAWQDGTPTLTITGPQAAAIDATAEDDPA